MHKDRIFFNCFCYGGAATGWLARMLNSHPDVLCLHGPKTPDSKRNDSASSVEMAQFIFDSNYFGGEFYPYVGFTHGLELGSLDVLKQRFGPDNYRAFILIRHPVTRLNSIMALRRQQATGYQVYQPAEHLKNCYDILVRRAGRNGFSTDYESLCFYEICVHLLGHIVKEDSLGLPVFTMEALTTVPSEINKVFAYISDGQIFMEETVIAQLQSRPLGVHSGKKLSAKEIFDSWSDERKEAFVTILGPKVMDAYRKYGYDMPSA